MNALFSVIFICSTCVLIALSPDSVLVALTSGGERALSLSMKMAVTYAVWLGVTQVARECGLLSRLSALLRRPLSFLLGKTAPAAAEAASANLAANVLGMGGVATPMGKRATELLNEEPHADYKQSMLFVLNATGIQLLPTSVLSLRTSLGSAAPGDVVLPCLLATAVSTTVGVLLVKVFLGKRKLP